MPVGVGEGGDGAEDRVGAGVRDCVGDWARLRLGAGVAGTDGGGLDGCVTGTAVGAVLPASDVAAGAGAADGVCPTCAVRRAAGRVPLVIGTCVA